MKKYPLAILFASALVSVTSLAHAGEVKVTWQDPDKYTDIRPTSETREAFQQRVTKELDAVFQDLAKKLPDGVQWEVTVTDLDLAGDVRPPQGARINDIRIVKDLYWPRMSLHYKMSDSSGKVLAEAKEDIKDMNFLMSSMIPSGHTSLQYEEKMLTDWFKKQQREQIFPSK